MTAQSTPRVTPDAAHWPAALRDLGRRVTKQRLAVLDGVDRLPHATAEDVLDAARSQLPDLTVQSVYLVLTDLTEWGLVRKIHTPGSPARYETRTGDNHHHVMCVQCGAVRDVSCVVGSAPCLDPSETGGMRIVAADVLFRGLCAGCDDGQGSAGEQTTDEQVRYEAMNKQPTEQEQR